MDKRNRPALGFLLVGIGVAGRALMAVPESVGMAELALSAMMVIGYLMLVGQAKLPPLLGTIALAAELYLSGTDIDISALPTALLRLADLWLLYAAVTIVLHTAKTIKPELFGKFTVAVPFVAAALLALHSVLRVVSLLGPGDAVSRAAMVLFVTFSVSLLAYTVLLIRAYNALRVKKEKHPHL